MPVELGSARSVKLHYWEWVAIEPMAAYIAYIRGGGKVWT